MLRAIALPTFFLMGIMVVPQSFSDEASQSSVMSISEKAIKKALHFVPESASVTDQAVKQAMKENQRVMGSLEINRQVIPDLPKIDLMNIKTPSFNIEELAQQGHKITGMVDEQEERYESQVLVFISSSMPQKTIQNYLHQTREIGAALVFRGLINDSMKDTQAYWLKIMGINEDQTEIEKTTEKEPIILIDPTLYERFDIKQVPITVVTESQIKPCQQNDCPTPVYHSVTGDVSLAWSLGLVSRQVDSDSLKTTLRPLIKHLERSL